jgi:sulfate adenylyltransferase subunit 1 (EFTu-like GTPase family)
VFSVYRHLSKGATAKVKIQLSHRCIPLETFKDNKQLGRIMLRKGGETVAAGVVDEVTEKIAISIILCDNSLLIFFFQLLFRLLALVPDYLI